MATIDSRRKTLQERLQLNSDTVVQSTRALRASLNAPDTASNTALANLREAQLNRGSSFKNTAALLSNLAPTSIGAAFGAGVFSTLQDFSEERALRVDDAQQALDAARLARADELRETQLLSSLDQTAFNAQQSVLATELAQLNRADDQAFTIGRDTVRNEQALAASRLANRQANTRASTQFENRKSLLDDERQLGLAQQAAQLESDLVDINAGTQDVVALEENQVGLLSDAIIGDGLSANTVASQETATTQALARFKQALNDNPQLSGASVAQLARSVTQVSDHVGVVAPSEINGQKVKLAADGTTLIEDASNFQRAVVDEVSQVLAAYADRGELLKTSVRRADPAADTLKQLRILKALQEL